MNTWINKIRKIFGEKGQVSTEGATSGTGTLGEEKNLKEGEDRCPYCESNKFFRRGKRKKKLEIVQLYQCKGCDRTFTSQFSKGRHYPINLIIDSLSYYNLGFGLEDTCRIIKQKFGVNPGASTLANWVSGIPSYAYMPVCGHLPQKCESRRTR